MKTNAQVIKNRIRSNQSDQILIRNPSTIKGLNFLKSSKRFNFVDYFFKSIKNTPKNILPQKSVFLIYQFLTECGKIRPRMQKNNMSIKKHKAISKLIKKAREFKIIPFVFKISL